MLATLGNIVGVVNSWGDTQIIATVASGAGPGSVLVTQSGVSSNTVPFSMIPASLTTARVDALRRDCQQVALTPNAS
jgi:hypothetical protein